MIMKKNEIDSAIAKLFDLTIEENSIDVHIEKALHILKKLCMDKGVKSCNLGDEKIGTVINISFINKRCKIHSNNLLECRDINFELFDRIVKIYLMLERKFAFILNQVKRWE